MNCLQSRIPSESLPYTHCSFVICYCTSCFIPSTYESLLYAHCSFVLSYCTSYESLPCARCFLVLYYHPSSFRTSCEQRRLCRCVNPQRQFSTKHSVSDQCMSACPLVLACSLWCGACCGERAASTEWNCNSPITQHAVLERRHPVCCSLQYYTVYTSTLSTGTAYGDRTGKYREPYSCTVLQNQPRLPKGLRLDKFRRTSLLILLCRITHRFGTGEKCHGGLYWKILPF